MKIHHSFQCGSLVPLKFSSFFIIFPKHADAFAPSWHKFLKFCHDGDRLLTGHEACTSFDGSNKEHCSSVRTAGAKLGI